MSKDDVLEKFFEMVEADYSDVEYYNINGEKMTPEDIKKMQNTAKEKALAMLSQDNTSKKNVTP